MDFKPKFHSQTGSNGNSVDAYKYQDKFNRLKTSSDDYNFTQFPSHFHDKTYAYVHINEIEFFSLKQDSV